MRPGRCDRIPWGLTRIKTHIGGWCSHDSFGAPAPESRWKPHSFAHHGAPLSRGGFFFYQGLDV